ncbi:hypothetical protein RFI_18164, partial [Reticulomyxa filosa]
KAQWVDALIQSVLTHYELTLPEKIAHEIIMNSIIVPGCYSFSGVLFPPQRTETDLFVDYCQLDTAYKDVGNKVSKGIRFKRKKPKPLPRRPENNTSSLWLDEDGTICGFRCVWVQAPRRQMILDQKYAVSTGCWTLNGEISVSFEQFFAEDVFTGYLEYEHFSGQWNAGNEYYGKFQYFVTNVMSYYLHHHIDARHQMAGYDFEDSECLSTEMTPTVFDDSLAEDGGGGGGGGIGGGYWSPFKANAYSGGNGMLNSGYTPVKRHVLNHKLTEVEVSEHLVVVMHFSANNVLSVHIRDINRMFHGESEEIGRGSWTNDGVIHFAEICYIPQKTVLEFHGYTDGAKVVGMIIFFFF